MSFHKNLKTTLIQSNIIHKEGMCFGCGENINGAAVTYDGYAEIELMKSILMHPQCAFDMAQRIICDTWPNRRSK